MPLIFHSAPALIGSAVLVAIIVAVAIFRRPDMPRSSQILVLLGLVLLCLAAGEAAYLQKDRHEVVVMVDLSPSTRTARYRDVKYLQQRIGTLLRGNPYRIVYFSDENRNEIQKAERLGDMASPKTVFNPPAASAVLLFSDGRFELPAAAPPTFIAVDPMLENPADGAVRQLEIRDRSVVTTVSNSSEKTRQLLGPTTRAVAGGSFIFSDSVSQNASLIAARLNQADDWPENDQLQIRVPPPILSERWWVGTAAPAGFKAIDQLPTDPAGYLAPSIIVLNNAPASAFSQTQLERLEQYTRDLGGSIILIGGDHAFAAGGYTGTALDALSPLASAPPTPTIHWMLLADSSGSMSAAAGGATRFELARQALRSLLPHLPPDDPVSMGSFAENLRWWSNGKSARETSKLPLPEIQPTGPTNLEPALLQVISQAEAGMPKELLILSDADTKIENPGVIEKGLKEKQIRLHMLLIGEPGGALPILKQISSATGGQILTELSPQQWTAATQKLFSMIAPNRLVTEGAEIRFAEALKALPARRVSPWNRTWMKKDAAALADDSMAAQWRYGSGTVAAFSFPANAGEVELLAKLIAQPPRDPRFAVTWTQGAMLHVRIDAADGQKYLNGEPLALTLIDDSSSAAAKTFSIPQSSPGRYEISIAAPTTPAFASVHHNTQLLDRIALAGRYAGEFEAIGNDSEAMQKLASRTAGAVINPSDNRPIDFDFPRRNVPLSSWLATVAFGVIGIGLILWRLR